MKLTRILGEESRSPGWALFLEILVLTVVAVLVGQDPGVMLGVSGILLLDFLGLRRFLQRRRSRQRLTSEGDDPLAVVDAYDFTEDWWRDLVAAGFYAFAFSMIFPTAMAYLEHGMLQLAIPLFAAAGIAGIPPVALTAEGLIRLYHRIRSGRLLARRAEERIEGPDGARTLSRRVVRKSVAYVTSRGRVLFFRADEVPHLGAELPGGTLEDGEEPAAGVIREIVEETGLTDLGPPRFLGMREHDPEDDTGETHHRYFFHVELRSDAPEAWSRIVEEGNGTFTFRFFWTEAGDLPRHVYPGHDAFAEDVCAVIRSS